MQRRFILSGLAGLLFVFGVGAGVASAQENFSGTWVLDKTRSSNISPATDISMTIVQKGEKVTISHRLVLPRGVITPKDTYVLNGATQRVTLDGPNDTRAKGNRMAKRIGGGFETYEEGTFTHERFPDGITVKTSRKWQLSPDGKTITLEITRVTNFGTNHSRRLFTKQ